MGKHSSERKRSWSRQYTKRTPSPCCFLLLTILFIFYLPRPHVIDLECSNIFGNMEWVELLQLLQLTFDWSRYLDSGRPGSPGSSQSEPSQTQNSPSNIASPIIFFCSNCGEELQQAVFGRTLQYQRFGNEVVCCCCGQNRQYGRYVSIPNNIYFWSCLPKR